MTLRQQRLAPSEYVREVALLLNETRVQCVSLLENETRVHKSPSIP